jgi:hypothetical protein
MKMPEKKPLPLSKVKAELSQRLALSETKDAFGRRGLSEKLNAVLSEVALYAFEYEGRVWIPLCGRQETDNSLFERCLSHEAVCGYAETGTPSCYLCNDLMFIKNDGKPE